MITKWIEFKVAAESAEVFGAELAKMQAASRPEDGCVIYAVYRSEDDPRVFTVLESWQTAEHLDAHRQTAHMATFKENCSAMIVEKSATSLQAIV